MNSSSKMRIRIKDKDKDQDVIYLLMNYLSALVQPLRWSTEQTDGQGDLKKAFYF